MKLKKWLKRLNPSRYDGKPGISSVADTPVIVDFGEITAVSPLAQQIDIKVDSISQLSCSIDAVSIDPNSFSVAGKYKVVLRLDFEKLVPGALLEGYLRIKSENEESLIRITGHIVENDRNDRVSAVIDSEPWKLFKNLSGHTDKVRCIAFITGKNLLISGSDDRTIRWWDIKTGQQIKDPLSFDSGIWSLSGSNDGQLYALGSRTGEIYVYLVENNELWWCKKIHNGIISELAFSPDNLYLAAGSGDRTISVWDVLGGTLLYDPVKSPAPPGKKPGVITSVAISGNGLVMASASQARTISLWELKTGRHLRELKGHQGNVWSIAFSLDGYILASGSYDKTVLLWDTQSGKSIGKLEGFEKDIYCVAVSPDGTLVATASGEPKVRIWESKSGKRLVNLEAGNVPIWKLKFSPKQDLIAGACDDGKIYIWAVGNQNE